MFHEMLAKLYFMKCSERKVSQWILPFKISILLFRVNWLIVHKGFVVSYKKKVGCHARLLVI